MLHKLDREWCLPEFVNKVKSPLAKPGCGRRAIDGKDLCGSKDDPLCALIPKLCL